MCREAAHQNEIKMELQGAAVTVTEPRAPSVPRHGLGLWAEPPSSLGPCLLLPSPQHRGQPRAPAQMQPPLGVPRFNCRRRQGFSFQTSPANS